MPDALVPAAHAGAALLDPLRPPQRLGRYELLAPLGSGGAATVYLARVRGVGGFEREVAIKVLHPHLREEPQCVADFLREARLAARIRHPHVVPVIDVGESASGVFLVMDYVEGVSLAKLAQRAIARSLQVSEPLLLRLVCDVLSGLHAAHELRGSDGRTLGLVHRDVSPQNVLVATNGQALLADFGIAKLTQGTSHTSGNLVKGKLPYMAPEQIRGFPLDRRSDVWAAGMLLWELLVGERVHAGTAEPELLFRLCTEDVPPLAHRRPDLPAGLIAAVTRATALDPAQRWSTAEAFSDALAKAGPLAEHKAVARFLREVAGAELARQDEARRTALAVSSERVPLPPSAPPRRALHWALGTVVVAGAVVGLVLARRPSAETPVPRSSAPPVVNTLAPPSAPEPPAPTPPSPRASEVAERPAAPVVRRAPHAIRNPHPRPVPAADPEPPLANNPYR